ncbi:hypothetical protein, partial [Priestia megaterium]|uniref:hypothetical protein n=1 Tax=Priestia megaterium TaxID=1404 RepID=UPI0035B62E4C
TDALAEAFRAIDAAQKTEFRVRTRRVTTELFAWPLAGALALLLAAAPVWGAGAARLRRAPP